MDKEKEEEIINFIKSNQYELRLWEENKLFNDLIQKYTSKIKNKVHKEVEGKQIEFKASNLVPPNISENSYYYISLMGIFLNLMESFGLLGQIRILILSTSDFNILQRVEGINEKTYLRLQYSNHTLVLNSIFDQLLCLVNKTLRIGIPDNDVRENIIKRNYWVKKYGINQNITQISTDFKNIHIESNRYRHLAKLRNIDDFQENNKEVSKNDIYIEVLNDERSMFNSINILSEKLLPVFRKWDSIIEKEL